MQLVERRVARGIRRIGRGRQARSRMESTLSQAHLQPKAQRHWNRLNTAAHRFQTVAFAAMPQLWISAAKIVPMLSAKTPFVLLLNVPPRACKSPSTVYSDRGNRTSHITDGRILSGQDLELVKERAFCLSVGLRSRSPSCIGPPLVWLDELRTGQRPRTGPHLHLFPAHAGMNRLTLTRRRMQAPVPRPHPLGERIMKYTQQFSIAFMRHPSVAPPRGLEENPID